MIENSSYVTKLVINLIKVDMRLKVILVHFLKLFRLRRQTTYRLLGPSMIAVRTEIHFQSCCKTR